MSGAQNAMSGAQDTGDSPPNKWHGRCFEAAFAALAQHPSGMLVHGTPLGHAGEVASIRYAHAWIELGTLLVVDLTMSGHPIMPRELYYRACGLDESHVKRYPRYEAYATLHAYEHYGPWHEPALSAA